MKKYILLFILLFSFVNSLKAAPAYVQGKSAFNFSSGPATATYTSTPTTNNLLFIVLSINGTTVTPTTPTGFTAATINPISNPGNYSNYTFYKISAGSENSPSIILGGGTTWWAIGITEYSGIDTSTPLRTNGAVGQLSSTTSGTTTGSATAGDLVIGTATATSVLYTTGNTGGAAATGRILSPSVTQTFGTVGGAVGSIEDNINASTGTTSATWTLSGGDSGMTCFIFAAASAGGSNAPQRIIALIGVGQ